MKKLIKRVLCVLLAIIALAVAIITVEHFGGQPMGLFAGSRPTSLGYSNGRFSPPSWKPNCVSSTVEKSDKHYIEPLAFSGAPDAAWKLLQVLVKATPRTSVIQDSPVYLYAEFRSTGLGFVDDVATLGIHHHAPDSLPAQHRVKALDGRDHHLGVRIDPDRLQVLYVIS